MRNIVAFLAGFVVVFVTCVFLFGCSVPSGVEAQILNDTMTEMQADELLCEGDVTNHTEWNLFYKVCKLRSDGKPGETIQDGMVVPGFSKKIMVPYNGNHVFMCMALDSDGYVRGMYTKKFKLDDGSGRCPIFGFDVTGPPKGRKYEM